MKHDTVVTAKGQVTIPKHIRDRNGIAVGTRLEVSDQGGDIVLRRAKRATADRAGEDKQFRDYLERVRGSLKLGMSTDEYMQLLRGE